MAAPARVSDYMLDRKRVSVKTKTRDLEGRLFGIFLSPFSNETRAQLVDDEGRVHYFFIERAAVEPVEGWK